MLPGNGYCVNSQHKGHDFLAKGDRQLDWRLILEKKNPRADTRASLFVPGAAQLQCGHRVSNQHVEGDRVGTKGRSEV